MQTGTYPATSIWYGWDEGISEDCLYLNVWTGAKSPTDKLPVIVSLYYGVVQGSSAKPMYDGTALAKKGAVVVGPNFRLGVFAFLAHPELDKEPGANNVSGNYYNLDQIAALKWVQKNIAAFGGDPNNVTVFGTSTGSTSICDLTTSPLAKGLFQKGIGTGDSCWRHGNAPGVRVKIAAGEQQWVDWAKKNFNASTIAELRAKSAWDLVKVAGPLLVVPSPAGLTSVSVNQVVDSYVFPDYPNVVYAKGQQMDIPLLLGWSKDEGTVPAPMASTAVSYTAAAQTRFGKFANQFLQVYPAKTDAEAVAQSQAMLRENYAWSLWEWAKAHSQTGKTKTYMFYWTYAPTWLPGVKFAEGDASKFGAYRTSDLNYIFGTLGLFAAQRQYTDADYRLSDTMMSYWVNFAKTGDPNGPGLPVWPVFDEKAPNPFLYVGTQIQPGPVPNKAGLDFYEAFYNAALPPVK